MTQFLMMLCVALVSPGVQAGSAPVRMVEAFVGIPIDLNLPPHGTVKAERSSPTLAQVQISSDGKTLRLVPKALGKQTVVIQETRTGKIVAQYIVDINDPALRVIAGQVKTALADVDGISVSIMAGRVVIDGQVISSSEINRVHSVSKMYGDKIRSLVTVSPALGNELGKKIEREIGNPEIRVRIANGHILLEGFANSTAEAERAEVIAQMYTPNIVVDEAVADKKILKRHPN